MKPVKRHPFEGFVTVLFPELDPDFVKPPTPQPSDRKGAPAVIEEAAPLRRTRKKNR
jgi:hypothetical protein